MKRKLVINKPHRPIRNSSITITQRATPITIDLDEARIAEPVAKAWRDEVSRGIQSISATGQDKSHRYANVTGLLARGLKVVRQGKVWVTVPPPGRLDAGWTAEALARFLTRLAELVPAIGQPEDTFRSRRLREALRESVKRMVKVGRMRRG